LCRIFQREVESSLARECVTVIAETLALEECSVAGVGRFSAFTDGSLRVVFNDRTCLDMRGVHWERHVYDRLLAQHLVSCCLMFLSK